MNFYSGLPGILAGTAIASAIVIAQPLAAFALTGEQVNDIARQVTVLIEGTNPGSGVIIAREGETYYVLTANHVVKTEDEYQIITADKKVHKVDYKKVKQIPGVDLAVVEFSSNQDYKTARLANSDLVKEGATVFVSGWPNPGREIKQRIRQMTTGQVSARPEEALADGYALVYTNVTRAGMSGGPVLDSSGRVVGIHGRAEGEDPETLGQESGANARDKVGFNLAIPINTFLNLSSEAGIELGLRAENSAAAELSTAYVPPVKPDERDKINDIGSVLNTVNQGVNVLRGIRGIFGR